MDEVLTGRELCELFGISYDDIVKIRSGDQKSNLKYFVITLLKIDKIRKMISKNLKGQKL